MLDKRVYAEEITYQVTVDFGEKHEELARNFARSNNYNLVDNMNTRVTIQYTGENSQDFGDAKKAISDSITGYINNWSNYIDHGEMLARGSNTAIVIGLKPKMDDYKNYADTLSEDGKPLEGDNYKSNS